VLDLPDPPEASLECAYCGWALDAGTAAGATPPAETTPDKIEALV
jgi:hypothetical protein